MSDLAQSRELSLVCFSLHRKPILISARATSYWFSFHLKTEIVILNSKTEWHIWILNITVVSIPEVEF